ncbi:MAG: hypothetical protein IJ222_08955 [Bacteroidales bacterium]|nr:hypothetical protein [Bacteroidales bacterium]
MKKLFILAIAGLLIFTGCLSHIYDVRFPDNGEVVTIPSTEGSYYFEVTAGPETKTSFSTRLWSFEYRVLIDNIIINQQMVNIVLTNEHIHEGDIFKVDFTVPANDSSEQRNVVVEVLKARDSRYYEYHVDANDNDWQVVWKAIQLGR